MKRKWQNLQQLFSKKYPEIENEPGIYFLRWVKNGNPVVINRLGGADPKGLLYIGETKTLRRRFQRLWRGINLKKIKSNEIHPLRQSDM